MNFLITAKQRETTKQVIVSENQAVCVASAFMREYLSQSDDSHFLLATNIINQVKRGYCSRLENGEKHLIIQIAKEISKT